MTRRRRRSPSGLHEADDVPAIAETILADGFIANVPPDLDSTTEDLEAAY